jgi:hypothetical protein
VDDELRFAVEQAVLAPSSHNTQPWQFRLDGDTVELYADRHRVLHVIDPQDRELVISCGAALLNIELAIAHLGRAHDVEVFPEPGDPDLLARVTLGRTVKPAPKRRLSSERSDNAGPTEGRSGRDRCPRRLWATCGRPRRWKEPAW